MRTRWWLLLIWMCFVARAAFYSAAFPLWEGFDEWSHFAVAQRIALRGEILVSTKAPITRDIQASLELAPVPWELRYLPSPSVTEDSYWRLPVEDRDRREAAFRSIPASWAGEESTGPLTAYEALQPPLYGWIMAAALGAVRGATLGDRVLYIRWLSTVIASLTIPLTFLIGRSVFRQDRVALGCAAVVAVMPEFAIDVARVGNECISVVLFTMLTWLMLDFADNGFRRSRAFGIGAALGLGLLAKAYFLAAILAVALLLVYDFWRARDKRLNIALGAMIIGATSFAIGGWWYVRNIFTTGTVSNLPYAVTLRNMGLAGMLKRIPEVHWRSAIDTILFSHLWFGAWSSLTIRSWMYHLFYAIVILAALGVFRILRQSAIASLAVVYVTFWVAQCYNALLYYLSFGISASMGWYMYALVGAEVALCVAGLRAISGERTRNWIPFIGVALFALLDLYTIHAVAIPYYTGVIAHRANSTIAALHLRDVTAIGFHSVVARLTAFKSNVVTERVLLTLWSAYALATMLLFGISLTCCRSAGRFVNGSRTAPNGS